MRMTILEIVDLYILEKDYNAVVKEIIKFGETEFFLNLQEELDLIEGVEENYKIFSGIVYQYFLEKEMNTMPEKVKSQELLLDFLTDFFESLDSLTFDSLKMQELIDEFLDKRLAID